MSFKRQDYKAIIIKIMLRDYEVERCTLYDGNSTNKGEENGPQLSKIVH